MSFPKIDGYVVTEKLGSGSYSTVYKAYTKVGGRSVVAIKCVDKERVKASGAAVDNLVTEIRLLKQLQHPHIVHMKNFTWDHKNIYIIMEFCCGGDLSKYIRRYGRVPEHQVLYFLQQLASALKFFREKGVVHLDLKPHNLLLHKDSNGKYILKVADFGFASHLTDTSAGGGARGSPLYMAPEVYRGKYDARADLWSVGVIMYECLFGRAPYSSGSLRELLDKVQRADPIQIPAHCSVSEGCRSLLLRLLRHDPDARISYEEFFADEYLDLEHMPTKENYDKAVSLIKLAIERDCAGRAREALPLYTDALRRLVPCVRAETDAARRSALTAKLTRYMERAEEIKMYLKCKDAPAPAAGHVIINNEGQVAYTASASETEHSACAGVSGTERCACSGVSGTERCACAGVSGTERCACAGVSGTERCACAGVSGTERCACAGVSGTERCACAGVSGTERCACSDVSGTQEVNGTVEEPVVAESEVGGGKPADVKSGAKGRGLSLKRWFSRNNPPPLLENDDSSISTGTKDTRDPSQDACRIT